MTKALALIGEVFGRWTVLERATNTKHGETVWLCRCECGIEREVLGNNLRRKISKSCGCLHNEQLGARQYTHGLSTHPLFHVWWHMVDRCTNAQNKAYKYYGERGIKVCDRWLNITFFVSDMFSSYKPGLTIERVDNNGNYELGNCEWVTRKEQVNNRRNTLMFTVGSLTLSLVDWSKKTGIHYECLCSRLRRGWSIEKAIKGGTNVTRNIP